MTEPQHNDGCSIARVTPMTIEMMLVCYFSPKPEEEFGRDRWDSEAGKATREWLFNNNLINVEDRATERGKAWIAFICETPLPEMAWRLPHRTRHEQ